MDQTFLELIVALLLLLVFIATCCALALAVYLNDLSAPRSRGSSAPVVTRLLALARPRRAPATHPLGLA